MKTENQTILETIEHNDAIRAKIIASAIIHADDGTLDTFVKLRAAVAIYKESIKEVQ